MERAAGFIPAVRKASYGGDKPRRSLVQCALGNPTMPYASSGLEGSVIIRTSSPLNNKIMKPKMDLF
jgi:hypothetical protein